MMRGERLHLCSTAGHAPMLYTGETCPYCTQRIALDAALQRIRSLERKLAELTKKEQ